MPHKHARSFLYEWGDIWASPPSPLQPADKPPAVLAKDIFAAAERLLASQGSRIPTASGCANLEGGRAGSSLSRDVVQERSAIEAFELAAKVSVGELFKIKKYFHDCWGASAGERDAPQTETLLSYEQEEEAIDRLVRSAEHAMELLWAQPRDLLANAQRAVSIGARVVTVVSSYRTLCYFGWAQHRLCFLMQDLSSRAELEESVVLCMLESLADLNARFAASQECLTSSLVESTLPIELKCCMALSACARYDDALSSIESLVQRMSGVRFGRESTQTNQSPFTGKKVFNILDFTTTRIVAAYAVLANLCTTCLRGGLERALVVTELCVRDFPSHPVGHLMLCHLHRRLGVPQEEVGARLRQVLQVVTSAMSCASDEIMSSRVPTEDYPKSGQRLAREDATGTRPLQGDPSTIAFSGAATLPQLSAYRSALSIVVFCATTALQCGYDDLALAAVESGIEFNGVYRDHTSSPPDSEALAHFLALRADVCLRKAMALFQVSNVGGSDAFDAASPAVRASTGIVSPEPRRGDAAAQGQRAEEFLIQSERHVLRSLQLHNNIAWAHLVNARRQQYCWERASLGGGGVMGYGADVSVLAVNALLSYESAIRCNPRLAEAYEGAGQCHLQVSRLEEASEMLLTSITLQSKSPLVGIEYFLSMVIE